MHQLCTNLTFISDPGHGWVRRVTAYVIAFTESCGQMQTAMITTLPRGETQREQ